MTSGHQAERVLVVANETVAGRSLIEAVKAHAAQGPISVRVVCPQNRPRHGLVVHDESVREAAANRLALTDRSAAAPRHRPPSRVSWCPRAPSPP